uniref:Putative ixodes 8-cys protein n=1 Tax=Ixodes ricinus TaxID=34613 RepID=A0A0K8RGL5_IXORI
MFKLSSFLVVFVLAGLCFGASSEDDSSSGKEASTGAGGGDTGDTSPGETDGSSPNSEAGESSGNKDPSVAPGNIAEEHLHLPAFVGDVKNKTNLLNKLVTLCQTSQPLNTASNPIISKRSKTSESYDVVNQDSLNFTTCTFKCKKSTEQEEITLRMPMGTVCNDKKDTCGITGDCPLMPLPAC